MPQMEGIASDVKDPGDKSSSDRGGSPEAPLISAQRAALVAAVLAPLLTLALASLPSYPMEDEAHTIRVFQVDDMP